MAYDPAKHRRRSIRMPEYDYSEPGAYFLTVCVQDRRCLLGRVEGERALSNVVGAMIGRWWQELPNKFALSLDTYVVMPNHVHGILITHSDPAAPLNDDGVQLGPSLFAITQWFKTMTTNEYFRGVKEDGWPRVREKLWQRNYYEHVIRTDDSHNNIREYIETNPMNWELDPENPDADSKKRPCRPWEV